MPQESLLAYRDKPMQDSQEKEPAMSKRSVAIIVAVFGVFALLALGVTLLLPAR